jgi:hypothetical protein
MLHYTESSPDFIASNTIQLILTDVAEIFLRVTDILEAPLAIRVTDPVTVNIQEMFVVQVGQVYSFKICVEVKVFSKNFTQAQRGGQRYSFFTSALDGGG